MRKIKLLLSGVLFASLLQAQETFPVNGVADKREGCYAFTNATIIKDAQTTLTNATLVIRDGKIVSAGTEVLIPKDAVVIDCKDKYIYPSFIDIYTDYGMPQPVRQQPGAGGVEGADPHPLDAAAHHLAQALAHLLRRLVGEGDRQDLPRRHPALDQPRDAVDQDAGLAGAGAGEDEERPVAVLDRRALLGVERGRHRPRM